LFWKNSKLYCGYNSWCIECERKFRFEKNKWKYSKIRNKIKNITYTNNEGNKCIESWKDIPGYEGIYQISDAGRLKSLDGFIEKLKGKSIKIGKLLSICYDKKGYSSRPLFKNKKSKTFRIHVLVAMAFLGHIPCGYKVVVDHKNNNKKDNRVCNLQIITQRKNASKDKKGDKYTCGSTGVSFIESRKTPYECRIKISNKTIYLGVFKTEKEASDMYLKALKNIDFFDGDKNKFKNLLGYEKKGHALTEKKVLAIRRLYRINPSFSRSKLAKKLNVNEVTIRDIIFNRTWQYLL